MEGISFNADDQIFSSENWSTVMFDAVSLLRPSVVPVWRQADESDASGRTVETESYRCGVPFLLADLLILSVSRRILPIHS